MTGYRMFVETLHATSFFDYTASDKLTGIIHHTFIDTHLTKYQ